MIRSHTRSSSIHLGEPESPLSAMYHRQPPDIHHPHLFPPPTVSPDFHSPQARPLTPKDRRMETTTAMSRMKLTAGQDKGPTICGMPMKYFSSVSPLSSHLSYLTRILSQNTFQSHYASRTKCLPIHRHALLKSIYRSFASLFSGCSSAAERVN